MTQRRPAPAPCDRPCAGLCRPDGFAAAHREYRRRLVARARAVLGDPESAEDAVQEAFLRALGGACSAFDPTAGPTLLAWLSTITRNVVVDLVRARAARPQLPRTEPDPGDAARGGRRSPPSTPRCCACSCSTRWPRSVPTTAAWCCARCCATAATADVAAELELPVGTVRSRAHYALRGLRRSLERADLAA